MRALLGDPEVTKVFHACEQDVAILERYAGVPLTAVFDTQVAGALAGYPFQVGYAKLVRAMLGIELDKESQFTDWLQRPLTEEQLRYAEGDVEYLAQLYPLLCDELTALERLSWAHEDSARAAAEAKTGATAPHKAHRNVKKVPRLNARKTLYLRELAAWRERHAREVDRRPHLLVPDRVLIHIASRGEVPENVAAKEYRSVQRRVRKLRSAMSGILSAATDVPEGDLPAPPTHRPLTTHEKKTIAAADGIVRAAADRLGIHKSAMATKGELTRVVRHAWEKHVVPHTHLASGWRRGVFGHEVVQLIARECGAGSNSDHAPEV